MSGGVVKSIVITLVFTLGLGFGLLPIYNKGFNSNPKILGTANSFAGGIFLAICLVHLMPEADEHLTEALAGSKIHFPFSHLIVLITYTFILCLDKVIFAVSHNHGGSGDHDHHDEENHHPSQLHNEELHDHPHKEEDHSDETSGLLPKKGNDEKQDEKNEKANIVPYILLTTLMLHSTFEGIALGLQTKITNIVNLALGILLHKWAESLTLGVNFAKAKIDKGPLMIGLFSLSCPIGIMIGWFFASKSALMLGIFLSIASGTFLFISSSEVIAEEFGEKKHRWLKFLFYSIGAIFIIIMKFLEENVFTVADHHH